ncbi:MAG: MerR family transcriptional regulator [Prolixibacteraceae bacterium]|nr:MerR family transcriptional regulator [Prolixibacteraceae bacterium]
MPYKKPKIEKHFYTIGEVADMFGVNTSLIRFWEKKFDNIKPQKNAKGNRLFTPDAIEEVRLVFHLVKERGMTLDGAQQKIKENKEDTVQEHEIVKRLQTIREMLTQIKQEL